MATGVRNKLKILEKNIFRRVGWQTNEQQSAPGNWSFGKLNGSRISQKRNAECGQVSECDRAKTPEQVMLFLFSPGFKVSFNMFYGTNGTCRRSSHFGMWVEKKIIADMWKAVELKLWEKNINMWKDFKTCEVRDYETCFWILEHVNVSPKRRENPGL